MGTIKLPRKGKIMPPSIGQLTHNRSNLRKGDGFKLHAEGAKRLNAKWNLTGENAVHEDQVLYRHHDPHRRVVGERKDEEVWLESKDGVLGMQVPMNEDLFSGRIEAEKK